LETFAKETVDGFKKEIRQEDKGYHADGEQKGKQQFTVDIPGPDPCATKRKYFPDESLHDSKYTHINPFFITPNAMFLTGNYRI